MYLRRQVLPARANIRRADVNIHVLGEDEEEAPRRAGSKPVFAVFLSVVFVSWARADGRVDVRNKIVIEVARKRKYLRRNMLPAMASIRREDTIIYVLGEGSEWPQD
jgi:hypothetical protein